VRAIVNCPSRFIMNMHVRNSLFAALAATAMVIAPAHADDTAKARDASVAPAASAPIASGSAPAAPAANTTAQRDLPATKVETPPAPARLKRPDFGLATMGR
jgi:hypothetical protein